MKVTEKETQGQEFCLFFFSASATIRFTVWTLLKKEGLLAKNKCSCACLYIPSDSSVLQMRHHSCSAYIASPELPSIGQAFPLR